MSEPLKICFAAAEVSPFAKTGGLADVAGALPRELRRRGHDVRLFLPLHGVIDGQAHGFEPVDGSEMTLELDGRQLPFSLQSPSVDESDRWVYAIDCPELFRRDAVYTSDPDEGRRFGLFSAAVLRSCQQLGFGPQILHGNDWHTALLPFLLRSAFEWDQLFGDCRTVLTIHNIGYQGQFASSIVGELGLGAWSHLFDREELESGRVNLLRTGLLYADMVTTVSPTYAREIQTAEYGMGLEGLLRARSSTVVGILNGVDYDEWSPDVDRHIPFKYSADDLEGKTRTKRCLLEQLGLPDDVDPPLIGMVSRLTSQKGLELLATVIPDLLSRTDARLAVLGTGEARFETMFQQIQARFPRQAVHYRGYSDELAHLIEAGADLFLMPSRYEPCGLNQMYSLKYGTIPVVRKTGGLADSVEMFDAKTGEGTGFLFEHFDPAGLSWALNHALTVYRQPELWRRLIANAMSRDFSWRRHAGRYEELYSTLTGR